MNGHPDIKSFLSPCLSLFLSVTNPLGAFAYTYVDETSRLLGVTYPTGTGLTTSYGYFNNVGDQRLQEIKNLKGTTPLSDFQYTYNAVGTIATWQLQTDSSTPTLYTLTYDNADRLNNAVLSNTSTHAWVNSYGYLYDPAGNLLVEKWYGGGITAMPFNNLNQLTGITSSSTSTTVAGHTSGTISSISIDDAPATISGSTNFTTSVSLPAGTNVVSVVAQPSATGVAIATQRYQIVTAGVAPTMLSYDLNGNCTKDQNGYTYTWDALNRVTSAAYHSGAHSGTHTEFAYDGLSRRTQIVERNGTIIGTGSVTSTKNYLWIGQEIAEERNATNTVTKRFFPQGEQQSATNYYYTSDHLGSVRELCSSTGAIVARYSYDPYGRTTLVSGSNLATFQYAGYYMHQPSGLYFTLYRSYDSNTGRWLSRDPIGESGGIDLYDYVGNDPADMTDSLGLVCDGERAELKKAQDGLKAANQTEVERQDLYDLAVRLLRSASKPEIRNEVLESLYNEVKAARQARTSAYDRLSAAQIAWRKCDDDHKGPPPAVCPAPAPVPSTPTPSPTPTPPPSDPMVPNRFPDQNTPANRPPAYRPAPLGPVPFFAPRPVW